MQPGTTLDRVVNVLIPLLHAPLSGLDTPILPRSSAHKDASFLDTKLSYIYGLKELEASPARERNLDKPIFLNSRPHCALGLGLGLGLQRKKEKQATETTVKNHAENNGTHAASVVLKTAENNNTLAILVVLVHCNVVQSTPYGSQKRERRCLGKVVIFGMATFPVFGIFSTKSSLLSSSTFTVCSTYLCPTMQDCPKRDCARECMLCHDVLGKPIRPPVPIWMQTLHHMLLLMFPRVTGADQGLRQRTLQRKRASVIHKGTH